MDFDINEHIQEILVKCLCGKADDRDYKEAYEWIQLKEENKAYFDSLYSAWLASQMTRKNDYEAEQRVWNAINLKRNNSTPIIKGEWVKQILKIAAIIIVAFSLGVLFHSRMNKGNIKLYTVEAPKGTKSRVVLADGTHVWLNAGSKFQYYTNYNENDRDVFLTGEAYFEVAKNKSKPFRVHAGGIVVKALGTVFNVKAYPEEKVVETTLVEGLVSIEKGGTNKNTTPVLLKPKQHAVYYKTSSEIVMADSASKNSTVVKSEQKLSSVKYGDIILNSKIEPEIYTSWKDKRWVFQNETFGAFAIKLERLYNIPIVIEDPSIKEYKLTGSIEEENIEMVLKALQLIVPMEYSFHDKQLFIKADKELKNKFDQIIKKQTTKNAMPMN
jgi:ferric-dicitrate binding protein FerR (iron transport regulator)